MTKTASPILFSAPMVRAILARKKRQTRRIMKPQPPSDSFGVGYFRPMRIGGNGDRTPGAELFGAFTWDWNLKCRYGEPGGTLWVRENFWEPPKITDWMLREGADTWPRYCYSADDEGNDALQKWGWRQRPSIHMPRAASRISLLIEAIRVEYVQSISEADAVAEGFVSEGGKSARDAFYELWLQINGRDSWDANPWVWVIEFEMI